MTIALEVFRRYETSIAKGLTETSVAKGLTQTSIAEGLTIGAGATAGVMIVIAALSEAVV